jgi:hypothetical protein
MSRHMDCQVLTKAFDYTASIFRVLQYKKTCWITTLKMEAVRSTETSVITMVSMTIS